MKHYVIERLSWDTSGKEKETWKQCNKREVEELTFVVEDLKEVSVQRPRQVQPVHPSISPPSFTGHTEQHKEGRENWFILHFLVRKSSSMETLDQTWGPWTR